MESTHALSSNTLNSHPRDKDISFNEALHQYTLKGIKQKPTSVTTVIHENFPKFDEDAVLKRMNERGSLKKGVYEGKTLEQIKEMWKKNGKEASEFGTLHHGYIENYLQSGQKPEPITKCFQQFLCFWEHFTEENPEWCLFRCEWPVFDEDSMVAGMIDCVLHHRDDPKLLYILDWKFSKEIRLSNDFQRGFGVFAKLDDCNYVHYSCQLSLYKHILEKKYDMTVAKLALVRFHDNIDNEKWQFIPVTCKRSEIDALMADRREKNEVAYFGNKSKKTAVAKESNNNNDKQDDEDETTTPEEACKVFA